MLSTRARRSHSTEHKRLAGGSPASLAIVILRAPTKRPVRSARPARLAVDLMNRAAHPAVDLTIHGVLARRIARTVHCLAADLADKRLHKGGEIRFNEEHPRFTVTKICSRALLLASVGLRRFRSGRRKTVDGGAFKFTNTLLDQLAG